MLDKIFGIYPNNIELYKLALIHRSASVFTSDGLALNNERLEYLGDAILQAITTDYLFIEFPESDEGFMTQLRSKIVSRRSLNNLCLSLGLDKYLIAGAGNQNKNKHIYGDIVEAMIGAIYLDKGYNFTNRLVINFILNDKLNVSDMKDTETDYKSRLIEWCQKNKLSIDFDTTLYSTEQTGEQKFIATVKIDGIEVAYGEGLSKKEAQQNAAYNVATTRTTSEIDHLLDNLDKQSEN
ncbi:MAG: ribonuclease III [Rikenellaceae bacterium]